MLTPSKHLDLQKSPLRIASEVLAELKRRRVMKYEAVTRLISKRAEDEGDAIVAPALSFLFLLGRIEYHSINDSFEYRGL